mmetsp:Transcript_37705/g.63461  ORF Transcript_37705/g.63461 Transcript_37705/m.63461 type:complete len:112 (-) Transcript_37705:28-363(-)|eukprot:CAMPEP_0198202824 /NCGR_PEP_ID=MMETSP1445-20131203/6046_1 /TAXON_ID=36898 /ORGANISM="Pyramimonas sp., Strain CCMP2087" /LENGTH=111 /DNA_ID=CAMNT_0043873937 /DNA_START=256 /DNA_END=591 /DNA_ORIENTATION=-
MSERQPREHLKSIHKHQDPNAPLFEEWADSPSSFSVVTHSIREMNDKIYNDVQQHLPSLATKTADDNDDEDDDDDVEPIIFSKSSSLEKKAVAKKAPEEGAEVSTSSGNVQ